MEDYNEYTDQALAALLKDGNEFAFVELYNRYKLRIIGNLFKLLKSQDLAIEFSQDLFLKIWDGRTNIDPEQSFRSYLFKISENMVMDFFRKAARNKKMQTTLMAIQSEGYLHIEESVIYKQESKLFEDAVSMLSPQRKKVFILCKLEGKSYNEVSQLLGISVSTVSDHLVKANQFLKKKLQLNSSLFISTFALVIIRGI